MAHNVAREQELKEIEGLIGRHPEGLAILALLAELTGVGIRLNRRTLLRRLQDLVGMKRVIAKGMLKGESIVL